MKTFRELELCDSSTENYKSFLKVIIQNLKPDWIFDSEALNDYLKMAMKKSDEVICLKSPIILNRTAFVWFGVSEDKLRIYNIVPIEVGSLDYNEYNSILDRFYNDCIVSNIKGFNFSVKYSSDTLNVEKALGLNTFKLLKAWEGSCNKTTGNTHPLDFERWAAFIVSVHKEKVEFSNEILERWLLEERGWNDDDLVTRLILDFEYALDMLEYYDSHK